MCKCANGSVNSGFSQAKGLGSTMALSSPSTQHHANKLANVSKISKWMKEFLYFWFCNHIHSIHSPSSYAGGKNWSSIGFEKLWKDWAGRETLTLKISSDEFVDNELNISFGRQLCENLYTEDAEQKKKDKTHVEIIAKASMHSNSYMFLCKSHTWGSATILYQASLLLGIQSLFA